MILIPRHFVIHSLALIVIAVAVPFSAAQTTNWTNAAGGSYFVGTNWDNGVPTTGFTANIAAAGTYTVTFGTGANSTISGLTLNDANATFSQTNGTLTLSALNLDAGTYSFSSGTISGATITSTGGQLSITGSSATLNGVSVGAGVLNLSTANAALTIQGGTNFAAGSAYTLAGTFVVNQSTEIDNLTLTLAAGSTASAYFNDTFTIGPTTTLTTAAAATVNGFGGSSIANAGLIQETGSGKTLTIGSPTISNTGTGALGIVASGGGTVLINPGGAFTNSGRVEAMANSTVSIVATNWTNTGTFIVDNGATLNLAGTYTTAAIGTITRNGTNTVTIGGTLNNTSATLALTAATGSYNLTGTISGGSLTSDGTGQLVVTGPSGTLNGVAVGAGVLNLSTANSFLTIQGGTNFAAGSAYTLAGNLDVSQSTEVDNLTLTLGAGSTVNAFANGTFNVGPTTTLTTAAAATITGFDPIANAGLIQETGSGKTLTINPASISNTGTGALGIVASGGGTVLINPGGAFTNSGRVEAMANSTVSIVATNWTNTGTFIVDNGATLNLAGTYTTAAIGTITRNGTNTVTIGGTLNNTSATLALTAATGSYNLTGTISGGSLTSDGTGQLVVTGPSGTLNGVAVGAGVLNLSTANSFLTIQGGTNFAAGSAYTLAGNLDVSQSTEVDNLTLTLGAGSTVNAFANGTFNVGPTTTLTTAAAATITGFDPIANAGLIQETGSGKTLTINPASISNTGTGALGIVASGGGTVLINPGGAFTNSGRVEAMANSTVSIVATNWTNTGTFIVDNGATLNLAGTYTTAAIGTITRNGTNTVTIGGTLNNTSATLALTAATGSYNLTGTISGGSLTSDGTGQLVVTGPSGTLNGVAVGAGVLNLSTANSFLTIQGGTNFAAGSAYTLVGTLYVSQSTEVDNLTLTLGAGSTVNAFANGTFNVGASTTLTTAATATIAGFDPIANAGLIQETGSGKTLTINPPTFTNTGTLLVSGGGTLSVSVTNFTNISGTTLTGGTYHVIGPATGTSKFNFGAFDVQTLGNGTTVILEGANSVFDVDSGIAIDTRLTTLGTGSQLQVLNGRNYTVSNPSSAFTNNGTLLVSSTAGASTFSIPGSLNLSANFNSSTHTLTGGTWQVRGNATLDFGLRSVTTIGPGTTVELTTLNGTAASFTGLSALATNNGTFELLGGQNFSNTGPLTNAGTIQLGGGTLTVHGNLTNTGSLNGYGTIASNLQVNGGTFDPTGPITFTGNVDFNASTAVSDSGGSLSVTGTSTVHSGATVTVASGIVYGGTGSVTVNSGGILAVQGIVSQPTTVAGTVSGNATFTNSLTIQLGGVMKPGNSPGTITVGGGLTIDGDYDWDINGNDNSLAGGNFDRVVDGGITTIAASCTVHVIVGGGVNLSNPFWSQAETWSILSSNGGFTDGTLPQIVVDTPGYLAVFPNAAFGIGEQGNSLNVTWTPGAVRQSVWTGASSGNLSDPNNWGGGTAPDGTASGQLVFGAANSPSIVNDIPGTLVLNAISFTASAPTYVLTGNGLEFRANAAGGLPQIVQNAPLTVTIATPITLTNGLTVSGAGNLALTGPIGGPAGLTYAGAGVLSLSGANSYAGGTNIQSGTLSVPNDAALGTGNVTGAIPGTLSFTGTTTTTKSFAMNGGTITVAATQTVTFAGGTVSAAYLDGAGTFAAAGASLIGVTTTPSVTLQSTNAADQFVHFTNGGTFTVAAGLLAPVTVNGLTNQGSGSVTIGAGSGTNASNLQSYGQITLANGPSATSVTLLTNVGSTPIYLNSGSRTFVGTPTGNGFAKIDLNGQNLVVAGGLLVNNGSIVDGTGGSAAVVADFGSLVKGAGFFGHTVVTQNGGRFQAGNSPGLASFGDFTFGPGGVNDYVFAIDDAAGTAGPKPDALGRVSGWGLVSAVAQGGGVSYSGDFAWTADAAHPLTVALNTLVNPTMVGLDVPGPMADFDPNKSFSWPAVTWSGSYTGPGEAATLDAATVFDTSGFANPIAGDFAWTLDVSSKTLSLSYTPTAVPEPGTLALTAATAIGWAALRRRRLRVRATA